MPTTELAASLTEFRQVFWVDETTGRLDDGTQIHLAVETKSIAVAAARVPLYVHHTVPRVVTASDFLHRTLATHTTWDITPQQRSVTYFNHQLHIGSQWTRLYFTVAGPLV